MEREPLPVRDIEARLRDRFADGIGTVEDHAGDAVAGVDPGAVVEVAAFLRDDPALAMDFLDFVTAVDRGEDGMDVVTHLFSTRHAHAVRLVVRLDAADPRCPTLSGVFPGAAWHERETAEMFGVTFDGHPDPRKLLLDDAFEGAPLRKDFPLMSREVKPWPGATEGEDEE